MTDAQNPRRVHVVTTRTVQTYAVLFGAAREALRHAKEDESGQFFDCLSAITFCALTLEGYFNHVGADHVPHWSHFERELTPPDKLDLLSEALGIEIDRASGPFNHFARLFWFRNFTAHGKTTTEKITETHKLLPGEMTPTGRTQWECECTIQKAEAYLTATREMVEILHSATGETDPPFLFPSSASYTARTIDPERT